MRTEGGAGCVFSVKQNTVERRAVQTAGTDGDRAVVAPPAGIAEGTPIVVK